jgi:hypothetical protein
VNPGIADLSCGTATDSELELERFTGTGELSVVAECI